MKLYLGSQGIPQHLQSHLSSLLEKELSNVCVAYIGNAKDVDEPKISETLTEFQRICKFVDTVDLREYIDQPEALRERLTKADLIWVGGGNTFYLRWIVRESGFETIIRGLLLDGKVYGGSSAGSILAGPTLKFIDGMDEIEKSPEVIWDGLGLVDIAVLPHWENPFFSAEIMSKIAEQFSESEFNFQILRDDQAVIFADGSMRVVN